MRWSLALLLFFLLGSVGLAHGPELTALVRITEAGKMTVQMVDPLGNPVAGATASVQVGELNGKPLIIPMAQGPEGLYHADVTAPDGASVTLRFEAELRNEIFRMSLVWQSGQPMPERPVVLREFMKQEAAWWELVLFGGVTIGVIAVLVAALFYLPEEPAS